MKTISYQQARFLLSVAQLSQLPPDEGIEVAFVGRSNAGKSSVLNCVTHLNKLARVSKTPGRTQLINLFGLDEKQKHRLVDLPGYGYAKVPLAIKQQWERLIDSYLRTRRSLKGVILVMDIRHPLKEFDQQMLDWCNKVGLPVHILLNKSDKLSREQTAKTLKQVENQLHTYSNPLSVQTFSALKKIGLDTLTQILDTWYTQS